MTRTKAVPARQIAPKPVPMTTTAVARIYRAAARGGNGQVPPGGFEARAARAAAHNQRTEKLK
jgi:hypothetical protein